MLNNLENFGFEDPFDDGYSNNTIKVEINKNNRSLYPEEIKQIILTYKYINSDFNDYYEDCISTKEEEHYVNFKENNINSQEDLKNYILNNRFNDYFYESTNDYNDLLRKGYFLIYRMGATLYG